MKLILLLVDLVDPGVGPSTVDAFDMINKSQMTDPAELTRLAAQLGTATLNTDDFFKTKKNENCATSPATTTVGNPEETTGKSSEIETLDSQLAATTLETEDTDEKGKTHLSTPASTTYIPDGDLAWMSPEYAYMSVRGSSVLKTDPFREVCSLCSDPEHTTANCQELCEICWEKGDHLTKDYRSCRRCLRSADHDASTCTNLWAWCVNCDRFGHRTKHCATVKTWFGPEDEDSPAIWGPCDKAKQRRQWFWGPGMPDLPRKATSFSRARGRWQDAQKQLQRDEQLAMQAWEELC